MIERFVAARRPIPERISGGLPASLTPVRRRP